MDPGPDYYYPQDDYVKADPVAFSFGRQGIRPKVQEGDPGTIVGRTQVPPVTLNGGVSPPSTTAVALICPELFTLKVRVNVSV